MKTGIDFIKSLVDELFDKVPYSKEINNKKDEVFMSLIKEYKAKRLDGQGDMEAVGGLFSEYGTLAKAAGLAGFDASEIASWLKEEEISDEKSFRKFFKKVRFNIYFFTLFFVMAVRNVGSFIINLNPWLLISIAIPSTLAALFVWRYKKFNGSISHPNIKLNKSAEQALIKYSDRYTKRLINSICLFMAGLFYVIIFAGIMLFSKEYRSTDILLQISIYATVIQVVLYILTKNILIRHWINASMSNESRDTLHKHIKYIIGASFSFWIMSLAVLMIFKSHLHVGNAVYILLVVYLFFCLTYNLTLRKNIVRNNIHLNKKRAAVFGLAIFVFLGYQVMSMDTWFTQPYISTVAEVSHTADDISYDEESGIYTITTDKEDFKILQLTDIHLGGSAMSALKDYKALNACYDLISATKPDLVIVTGDLVFPLGIMSMSFNNSSPMLQFASFMRNVDIPWAFLYGNHDTESMASSSKSEVDAMLKSVSFKTSGNFLYPYIQPDITGRNNQLIEIRNTDGSLNQALFLMDSNDYIGSGVNNYDYIHDDEVSWYEEQVQALEDEEGGQVSSMVFFHMPLQQYKTAYDLYKDGSTDVKYYFGENMEGDGAGDICCSDYPSKLFDTAVSLGSTKAMFCGHDHYNNMSLEYKGIRLTYGMSIDYLAMPGIENETDQRGGTTITLHRDSTFDIDQIPLTSVPVTNKTILLL